MKEITSLHFLFMYSAVDKKAEIKPTLPEVVDEGKPVFKKLLSDTLVKTGETISLECVVDGKPTPTVSWSLNNVELQQSERIHVGSFLINISFTINELIPLLKLNFIR